MIEYVDVDEASRRGGWLVDMTGQRPKRSHFVFRDGVLQLRSLVDGRVVPLTEKVRDYKDRMMTMQREDELTIGHPSKDPPDVPLVNPWPRDEIAYLGFIKKLWHTLEKRPAEAVKILLTAGRGEHF
jgi:hypothetical protein